MSSEGRMMTRTRRIWYEQPGTLTALYLALEWLPFVVARVQGDIQDTPLPRALRIFAIVAFLAWRIHRGGRVSWAILMLASVWNLAAVVLGAVAPWSPLYVLEVAQAAVQLCLLFSPAIRNRLGPVRRSVAS